MAGDLDIVGGAAVDVVPIVPNFHQKLKTAILPIADRVGAEAGRKMGERMGETLRASLAGDGQRIGNDLGDAIGDALARRIAGAIPDAINRGGQRARAASARQGSNNAGAFADSMRRRLEAAFRAMPKLDIRLGDTGVDAELARVRAKLEQLSNKRIGIDVSAEAASAEVAHLEEQLRRLGAAHPNVAVRADTAAARAALAAMREEIAVLTADPARIRIETDGALGAKLRAAVQAAEASLPNINIGADTSPAQAEIASLRGRLSALRDVKIGIDMSAEDALAQVREIQLKLRQLSAQRASVDVDTGRARAAITNLSLAIDRLRGRTPTVDVRADAGQAEAELAAVHAMVNRLDRDDVRIGVHVNSAQATAALLQLSIAAGGVAVIPALPIIAAGLGAVASAGVAAGAGLGAIALVAIPAIKGVTNVMQLQKAAADESAQATNNGGAAQVKAAQQALTMANAQQALTSAHRQAAQSIAQANRQVQDAERAVAQAAQRAAEQRRQAAENVERAERALSDAKRQSRQAEQDLTQARKDAADQLRDLNDRLAEGALNQRDATLRVQEAQLELQRVMADPRATDLQRERAQLAYDQSVQSAKQQKQDYADLQKDAAAQRKAGVDGNADVKRATQQLSDAQRGVADQTKAVADAHRSAAQTQIDSAQSVADAQRGLSDAVQNAANAQVQASEQIKSAERGVESARLSGIDTTAKAMSAQEKYRKALANMTPAQRKLYDSIAGPKGLKAAFKDWSTSLQPDVLPIFTRGVDGMKNSLPGLTPLVKNSSKAVRELQDDASKELKKPFWQDFKKDIAKSAGPAIKGLGKSFGNILKGMAGVVDAFLPHMGDISKSMEKVTKKFANWGSKLKGSPEFEKFLDYAKENGPKLASTLKKVADAFFQIGKDLSPLSGTMLDIFGKVADGIGTVAEHAPWLIQLIWGLVIATKAWTLAMFLFNFVMKQNPLVRIILLIGLLAAIVVYAYHKFPWFKAIVDKCWHGIKTAVSFAWEKVLKPTFGFIWDKLKWVGDKFLWLWNNAVKPTAKWIGDKAKWLWEKAIKPSLKGIWDGLKWVGDKFKWLYEKGVKGPANWIADKASWLYNKGVKPAFDKIKSAVRLVGEAFGKAKDAIGKTWSKVSDIAKKPVNFIIKWVYTKGIKAVWDKVAGFVGLSKLPDAPKLLEAGGTVGNGWGPARPMRTNRPTAIVGEGNPRYPEYVIPTDPKYRSRALSLHQAAGTQLLESGGVIGGLSSAWDWTKDTVSDVVGKGIDWAKTGADLVSHPSKVWNKLLKPVLGKVAKGVSVAGKFGAAIGKFPLKIVSGLKDKIVNAVASMVSSDGGGGGVWQKPVNAGYGTRFGVTGPMWSSGHHTGLDFPAAIGTAVKAVADGTVSQVFSGGPYGNHVMVNHGGGLQSLYAHMSRIMTKLHAHVSAGQQIGKVGATGNVTGPHLHLEARRNGRAVDPMPFLQSKGFSGTAVGSAQKYAKSILGNYGWGASQFGPLQKLWNGESGWRWNAKNPSSGAYGIPQALPASKMASAGSDWRTNPATQIRWGLNYIKHRPDYGSPAAAYSKWLARSPHWYDDGGYLPPGLNLVANGTGKPEPVFTSGQWDTLRASKGGGATTVHADVKVFVGDREITEIVRTEVTARESSTATAIDNGRWG
ncbi:MULTISPECIES: peptidoglycan DD-metalloendopeptidase family protein [unclassified Streptomyces]|uniref:aggregation-promoting factor C-terminal-like domain-containing protein n=1 Tax=unclassified Streptomyces TaxID=2593676 RepID=UPI0036E03E14